MQIMTKMPLEFFGEVSIYFGIGVQVVTALMLGGIVGYDREKKLKSAGIKTNMLICLGATLYTSIGLLIAAGAEGMNADPNRIAAQIVSGIGFLGAGAIIQGRGSVIGMTTAAIIWVVAAIGFTIGAGYPISAAIFTVTVIVVLKMINPIYRFLESEKDYDYFQLQILSRGSVKKTVEGIIQNDDIVIDETYEEVFQGKKGRMILNLFMLAHKRQMERLVYEIRSALKVEKATYFSVAEIANEEDLAANALEKAEKNGSSKKEKNGNGDSKKEKT